MRSSSARWIASQIANPYGLITIAPRTAEFSARPARRTTWPYQAGKSCDCWGRRTALMTTSWTNVNRRWGWSRRFGPGAAEAPTPGRARAEAAERGPGSAGGCSRSGARSSCDQCSEPLLALRRPQRALVVVDLERRLGAGDLDPRQPGAGEDVDVRADRGRVVERPAADEPHRRMAVGAEDRHLADGAAEDRLDAAVVAGNVHGPRVAGDELDPVGLDQQVDDERAAGLALAVQAVAAVGEEGIRRQPVADGAARAPAFANAHGLAPASIRRPSAASSSTSRRAARSSGSASATS